MIYDDSVIIEKDWKALKKVNWNLRKLNKTIPTIKKRRESYQRIKETKSKI